MLAPRHSFDSSFTRYILPRCPDAITKAYMAQRGVDPGPFFCTPGALPVTSHQFNLYLKRSLIWCGLDHLNIKPHSFRIGAATWAASCGYTDYQIQMMGRWHSYAFKKYIRISSFMIKM